jgi:A/G-specific adenine glycosylase
MNDFASILINWYSKHKRDLPWRHTTNPYHIWLSEIMLQQTRVDQGLQYYLHFIKLFPSVHDLANASEDQVLKAWQGLGYYSRARNLHFTAKYVSQQLNGEFPNTYEGLLKLKGVGSYTAAAIASFCFREKVPVVDGNVIRVLSRYFAINKAFDSKEGAAAIQQAALECISQKHPDVYNQAIMEFGALHCTPRNPNCVSCPVKTSCGALEQNLVAQLPFKKGKTKVKPWHLYYFVIKHEDNVFFQKREEGGIWKGLHDFPHLESETALELPEAIGKWNEMHFSKQPFEIEEVSKSYTHLLSHRRISAIFIRGYAHKTWKPSSAWTPVKTDEIDQLGVPQLVHKYLVECHILNK